MPALPNRDWGEFVAPPSSLAASSGHDSQWVRVVSFRKAQPVIALTNMPVGSEEHNEEEHNENESDRV
jgi:hypothetical protein